MIKNNKTRGEAGKKDIPTEKERKINTERERISGNSVIIYQF
jgi:hypothetical protein